MALGRQSAEAGPSIGEIPGLRPQLVCPGDVVTAELGTLRGRGVTELDGKLVATTCGVVEHVNKLLYVRPLKHRYTGSICDVVVERVTLIISCFFLCFFFFKDTATPEI